MNSHRIVLARLMFLIFVATGFAQKIKTIRAVRTEKAPRIDGKIDDVWNRAEIVTGFYEFDPGFGNPAPPEYQTEVQVLYDDAALYILAVMHDPDPASISREFALRDQMVMSDLFGVFINPFRAAGNNYFFGVSAAGTQIDGINSDDLDPSWNAVWYSAVAFSDKAWIVEMAIPYSALRFQKEENPVWGINFIRMITRTRKQYSWTYIDKTKQGDIVQFLGNLTGMKGLNPPVRLSFYPYASVNWTHYKGENKFSPGFGLDLKYGLNENFTLDATLIPDFSDVPYDDVVLNLGPFEQYYNENRPFFTESMQLFNSGNIFYSRRIGSRPEGYYEVYTRKSPTEIIEKNPEKSQLINALKLSGRTKRGLGIGFLNAVTQPAYAVLRDTVTGKIRQMMTEPWTNFNVSVVDYAFGKNNSVGLINTNVLRAGDYKDANVTAAFYNLNFMHNTLQITGKTAVSFIRAQTPVTGWASDMEIAKSFARHTLGVELTMADHRYDINDAGYMRMNNYAKYDIYYRYAILKPTRHFNRFSFRIGAGFDHIYKPYKTYRRDLYTGIFATNKKFLSYGMNYYISTDTYDYYEPRVPGRYYLEPAHHFFRTFVSTDYRKKFAMDIRVGYGKKFTTDEHGYSIGISPRLRLSNRFKMIYDLGFEIYRNDRGYVTLNNNRIIFGKRDKKTVSQKLTAHYFFTVKSAASISIRHYWSPVHYKSFYILEKDGSLSPHYSFDGNPDLNFNVWNLDLGYSWEFSPGSRLSVLYRNSLLNTDQQYDLSYTKNLNNLFHQPQKHSFIVKMIYYLDYNTMVRRWF